MIFLCCRDAGRLAVQPESRCADHVDEATLRQATVENAEAILGPDVIVLGVEVALQAEGSQMRLDVLGLTRDLRLLVVEVKVRRGACGDLDDQVHRYVLAAESLSWEQITRIYQRLVGGSAHEAEAVLRAFAGIGGGVQPLLGRPRLLIVAAADAAQDAGWIARCRASEVDVQQVVVHACELSGRTILAMEGAPPPAHTSTAAGRRSRRTAFWEAFLPKARRQGHFLGVVTMPKHLVGESWGVSGARFQIRALHSAMIIELYIDMGAADCARTHEVYRLLHNRREAIEGKLGVTLNWFAPPDQRARVIAWHFADRGVEVDRSRWADLTDSLLAAFGKFKEMLTPELRKATADAGSAR
jgi:hypothetical protein